LITLLAFVLCTGQNAVDFFTAVKLIFTEKIMEIRTFLPYPPPELPMSVFHRVGGALGLAEHRHCLGAVRLHKVRVECVQERFHFWYVVFKNVPPQTLDKGGDAVGSA